MRRLATLITTLALSMSGLVFSPAHANGTSADGDYVCATGLIKTSETTNLYTITTGVVSNHTSGKCTGAVVIPEGVTSIVWSAFGGATALTSIVIPASVTTIGAGAFGGATLLTSINVHSGNTNYQDFNGVLLSKSGQTLIRYPIGLTATSFIFPAGVTTIGADAFSRVTSLTSITIPSSVTTIGNEAFSRATSLQVVTFEPGSELTIIGSYSFYKATSLTSIKIPASVRTIDGDAFDSATALASVTFESGSALSTIEDYAFNNASSLTTITIPSGVTNIGSVAFEDATSLTSVYFLGNAPTVGSNAFRRTAPGAKAYIKAGATGFTTSGTPALWNGLVVEVVVDAPALAPVIANAYRADNLGTVYFAPLSSKLSKAAKKQIKTLVTANPSAIYKISGYVQKSSSAKNDASLSLARAKAVETYLVSLGAGINFTAVLDAGKVPTKNGKSSKARRATLYAMTPVVQ